jgi:hypothetical protein
MLAGGGASDETGESRKWKEPIVEVYFFTLNPHLSGRPPTARITRTSPTRGEVLMARSLPPRFPYTNLSGRGDFFHGRHCHPRIRRFRWPRS